MHVRTGARNTPVRRTLAPYLSKETMAHPGFNLFDVRIYNGDVEAKAPCGTGVESAQLGRRVGGGRNRQNQAAVARINELPSTVGRAYTQTCARLWMQTVCGRQPHAGDHARTWNGRRVVVIF